MTIDKLNGLSIEALYALAEKVGLKLPEGLESVFVISELVEAFNEDSQDRKMGGNTAVHVEEKKFSGSELDEIDASLDPAACIECRYNETSLHVLVRDPGWAFVFWDIRDDDLERLHADAAQSSLFLRVTEQAGKGEGVQFDVAIGRDDSSWYIHLPEPDTVYSVELCCKAAGRVVSLSQAKSARTPKAFLPGSRSDYDTFSLEMAVLSGLDVLDPQDGLKEHSTRIMDEYN